MGISAVIDASYDKVRAFGETFHNELTMLQLFLKKMEELQPTVTQDAPEEVSNPRLTQFVCSNRPTTERANCGKNSRHELGAANRRVNLRCTQRVSVRQSHTTSRKR